MLQEAWGLVPDGLRVLLVKAESKLMRLKSRGARAGGVSDGASDLLGVLVLRTDTHGDLMSVREVADTTSRAFAAGGEDFAYYLNESRAMQGLTVIPTETPDWLTTITASLLSPRRMQIAVGMEKPPGTSFAGGGVNELELRRSL